LLASASPTATILNYNRPFGYEKSANGYRLKTRLSHAWGSLQRGNRGVDVFHMSESKRAA